MKAENAELRQRLVNNERELVENKMLLVKANRSFDDLQEAYNAVRERYRKKEQDEVNLQNEKEELKLNLMSKTSELSHLKQEYEKLKHITQTQSYEGLGREMNKRTTCKSVVIKNEPVERSTLPTHSVNETVAQNCKTQSTNINSSQFVSMMVKFINIRFVMNEYV